MTAAALKNGAEGAAFDAHRGTVRGSAQRACQQRDHRGYLISIDHSRDKRAGTVGLEEIRFDLLVGRLQIAVPDVVADRTGKQVSVLQNDAKRPARVRPRLPT